METKNKIFLITLLIVFSAIFIFRLLSPPDASTDLASYYRAGSIAIDSNRPIVDIYERSDPGNRYNIPEPFVTFGYSPVIAYLFAPLSLLPYNTAKAIMIILIVVSYALSVLIFLDLMGASDRVKIYAVSASFIWRPLISSNLTYTQVNTFIMLAIILAVLAAQRNRPRLAGFLLGFAVLFKVTPIAIALVLGLNNWRILAACVLTVAASFLVPGSSGWYGALVQSQPIPDLYHPIFNLYGWSGFALYSLPIAAITALIAFFNRSEDYLKLTALAIPAMLLCTHVMEYHLYTPLIITIIYLALKENKYLALLASAGVMLPVFGTITASLFFLWILAAQKCFNPRAGGVFVLPFQQQ
jgi:hypothetical protein